MKTFKNVDVVPCEDSERGTLFFLEVIHHVLGPCRDSTTKAALSPFILTFFPHSCVWTGVDLRL